MGKKKQQNKQQKPQLKGRLVESTAPQKHIKKNVIATTKNIGKKKHQNQQQKSQLKQNIAEISAQQKHAQKIAISPTKDQDKPKRKNQQPKHQNEQQKPQLKRKIVEDASLQQKHSKKAAISPKKDAESQLKRELTEEAPAKQKKADVSPMSDLKSISAEEQRRRDERDKRSLFLKAVPKGINPSKLKALHPAIASVRALGNHAWLLFLDEDTCTKALSQLSTKKIDGQSLTLDFCGAKSKNKPVSDTPKKSARPIDPLEIVVSGYPKSASKEQLQAVFPNAKAIKMLNTDKQRIPIAFFRFDNESEAHNAFKKGASLKIGGDPVDVYYSRLAAPKSKIIKEETTPEKKRIAEPKRVEPKLNGSLKKESESESDEDDDEELEDEDEEDESDDAAVKKLGGAEDDDDEDEDLEDEDDDDDLEDEDDDELEDEEDDNELEDEESDMEENSIFD